MSVTRESDYQHLITITVLAVVITILMSVSNLASDFEKRPLVVSSERPSFANPYTSPQGHARELRLAEADARFQQAVMMLHAKRYDMAVKALHRVLELTPVMPEAHSNMGYALLGTGEYKIAYDFFSTAVELRSMFDSAYYGMALSLEGLKEYEGAIGAMRTYLHLTTEEHYHAKAEEYIVEWRRQVEKAQQAQP